jgi:hypothetical protein
MQPGAVGVPNARYLRSTSAARRVGQVLPDDEERSIAAYSAGHL